MLSSRRSLTTRKVNGQFIYPTDKKRIQANYELNPSSIGPQTWYLGADVQKVTRPGDPSGKEYWSFSAVMYIKNAVRNVKLMLQAEGRNLKTTARTPFPSSAHRPETDTSDECDDETSHYSQLIGVLRWSVELGRIDINTETALGTRPIVGSGTILCFVAFGSRDMSVAESLVVKQTHASMQEDRKTLETHSSVFEPIECVDEEFLAELT